MFKICKTNFVSGYCDPDQSEMCYLWMIFKQLYCTPQVSTLYLFFGKHLMNFNFFFLIFTLTKEVYIFLNILKYIFLIFLTYPVVNNILGTGIVS